MNLRRIIAGFVALHTLFAQGQVQSAESLDSVRSQFETESETSISEFREYSQQAREEYERFEAQARAEYEQYVESVKLIWGGDSIIENTRTEWVEYSSDYTSRSIVDFDEGNISIEVALNEDETIDDARICDRLTQAIEQLLTSQGTTHPYGETIDTTNTISEMPILDGIVDFSAYRLADSDYFVEEIRTWDGEGLFSYLTSLEAEKLGGPNQYPDIGGQELHLSINHDGLWYVSLYDRMIEVCWIRDGISMEYFYLRSDVDWGLIESYLN